MQFDAIVQAAKEQLLAHGEHPPMFYAETATKLHVIGLSVMPDIGTPRRVLVFNVARKLALDEPGVTLRSVAFVSEGWGVRKEPGQPRKYPRNADDPDRMEILVIAGLTVEPLTQTLTSYEMLRDTHGKLVDLLRHGEDLTQVNNSLLLVFLAGYHSARHSDAELMRMALEQIQKDQDQH